LGKLNGPASYVNTGVASETVPLEGVAAELPLVTRSAVTIVPTRQDIAVRTPRDLAERIWSLSY